MAIMSENLAASLQTLLIKSVDANNVMAEACAIKHNPHVAPSLAF